MRARLALALAVVVLLVVPACAAASPRQLSIFQDDATLLGTGRDAETALAEMKALGVDMVRVFVVWKRVSPDSESRTMPAGFDVADPGSAGYDWSVYDAFMERARRHGLQVLFNLTPPIPYWASEEPDRCPHPVGGYEELGFSCHWKPSPKLFGQFAAAVVKRYGTQVSLWSMYNEPNLEHYVYPQLESTPFGVVDVAARRYRSLWWEGWKAVAEYAPAMRGKVLFGETAAISSPMDTLYAALCLDPEGRPFRGELRALQGCRRPRKLPIGGIATHPYAKDAVGSVFQRTHTDDSLPMAYINRLHGLIDGAARQGRIPPRRGIYLTEFGFQSNPPDTARGLPLERQAAALNEADRLFHSDPRVRSVAQYELFDAPEPPERPALNSGLRLINGDLKPAWYAYRIPLVASRLSARTVEIWGHVRPAERRTRVALTASRTNGDHVSLARLRTDRAGYFRFLVRRPDARRLRYSAAWASPGGELMRSREAAVGRRIRYLE